jgi:cytochrome P450
VSEVDVDLSDPALWSRGFPHELFRQLRSELPIFRHELTPGVEQQVQRPFWVCTKHHHSVRIHRDVDAFTATEGPTIQDLPTFTSSPNIVVMDKPEHTRVRGLISRAFTPRAVALLEDGIRRRSGELVGRIVDNSGGDWVGGLAAVLPMSVIGDIIGIPEADRADVFAWIDMVIQSKSPDSGITPENEIDCYTKIYDYATNLTAERRRRPGDDIWSTLCQATYETDDGTRHALEQNELDVFFFILSLAGSDTTKNALASGLQAFAAHPDQSMRYHRDPAVREPAVEEVLRWSTPVTFWVRTAREDVEMDGITIPAGDRVVSYLASANRDEDVFEDSFAFNIGRNPNPHVTFGGGGPHYCLGAMLARVEVRSAFDELFRRATGVEVGEAVVTNPNLALNMYVYRSLPMAVRP